MISHETTAASTAVTCATHDRSRPCCCVRGPCSSTVSAQSYMWEMSAPTLYRSWMSDRRSVVNIARRVDLQSRHSYPFSRLITSGRISLKQRNEQVDYRYMFYLLMTPFSWNMARQQHVKCNWLGGELGGRWHDSHQCWGQQDVTCCHGAALWRKGRHTPEKYFQTV